MKNIIGQRLKILRNKKGISQKQIAYELQISESIYNRIENGKSNSWANHILKICKFFEITPDYLIMEEPKFGYEKLSTEERQTEIALLNVYRKIIKKYELQIEELKNMIKHLNKDKN